jgi:hypothetical protein
MDSDRIISVTCSKCGKSVDLRTSQTDERGRAVHEECYGASIIVPIHLDAKAS